MTTLLSISTFVSKNCVKRLSWREWLFCGIKRINLSILTLTRDEIINMMVSEKLLRNNYGQLAETSIVVIEDFLTMGF
jgi:hypothetical protein